MALTTAQIQQAYVTFFSRPADPVGLAYWQNYSGSVADLYATFAQQTEYSAAFSGLTSAQKVNVVYQNLFGRDAEATGLLYWAGQVEAGKITVANLALAVSAGSQGTDKVTVDSRVSAATSFTAALDTPAEILGYTGATANAAAKTWLAGVTTAANLATAVAAIDTAAAGVVAVGGAAGSTFTLTTGVDTLVGTSANDTFNALPSSGSLTLSALDNIDGGAGTDTLVIADTSDTAFTLPGATIKNVENITLQHTANAATDDVTVDVSNISGVKTVSVLNSGTEAQVTVTTKSNATSVTVKGADVDTDAAAAGAGVTDSGTAATTADTLTAVTFDGVKDSDATTSVQVATVSSDALNNLTLKNTAVGATVTAAAGARALTLNLDAVTGGVITDAEATSLVVNAAGTKSSGVTLTTAKATSVTVNAGVATTIADVNIAAATALNVTGAGKTTVSATSTVTALSTIDASGSTGGLVVTPAIGTSVTFTGGAGADSVKIGATTKAINLGAGDDTVILNAVAALGGGSVAGGDGVDTLEFNTFANAVTASGATTFAPTVTGFEKLKLSGANGTAAAAVDLDNLNGIKDVTFSAQNTETISLNNLGDAGTVRILSSQTAGKALTITEKYNTATDVLNLVLQKDTALATTEVVAANIETVNLTLTESDVAADGLAATINHAATLTIAGATSLIATGNAGANLGTITGTKLTNIDFSGVTTTGTTVTFTTDALTAASTIVGSKGANTITASATTKAVTYTGADKVDTIVIANGKDNVVTLGGGNDSYTGGTGNETINAGAGDDAIAASTGNDVITGGAGNDTITFVANANKATYATWTDVSAGDIFNFADAGTETFTSTKISLASTATFADYLDQASAYNSGATTGGKMTWFQYGGDTYLVEDKSDSTTFAVGTDIIVKLSGLVDLKNSVVGDHILTVA